MYNPRQSRFEPSRWLFEDSIGSAIFAIVNTRIERSNLFNSSFFFDEENLVLTLKNFNFIVVKNIRFDYLKERHIKVKEIVLDGCVGRWTYKQESRKWFEAISNENTKLTELDSLKDLFSKNFINNGGK